jgi:hypothetical protein
MSGEKNQDENQYDGQGMHLDVKHFSVGGNVVIAGGDGSIHVTTGGDVEQTTNTSITVGGVETTRDEYDGMVSSLLDVQKTIEEVPLEPIEQEAAEQNLLTLETQLTSEKPPNPRILEQATKSLYRISPLIAGQLISLFSNPLVGQIVEGAGQMAINMRDSMLRPRKKMPKKAAKKRPNKPSNRS